MRGAQMKLLNNFTVGQLFRSRQKVARSSRSIHLLMDNSNFNVREAYKTCRTNVMFTLPEEKSSIIVLTSSWPMEGKTTNCANLAITFAQTGAPTLIIEGDLRKPRLGKMFELESKNGLTNCLRKFCSVSEAIHKTSYDNLYLMPSGHIPPNPAELLTSVEMADLLNDLKEKYAYILIDTPPVNILTDALVLARIASGTIVVARQGMTDYKSLSEAIEKIKFSNSKILGFILNDAVEERNNYYKYRTGYGKYNYYKKQYYNNYEYRDEEYADMFGEEDEYTEDDFESPENNKRLGG